ncbi:MAG: 1-acyl-sn-glycerol-3-phosphate acyltransferase [Oscillospiraceae bacterium]|nr:1-acyl-sn-glycerol-3-phosphate acyltransferase [Oscillospiraceae bacterium]
MKSRAAINFWNAFVKITGWPAQWVCFRTRIYYEDRAAQGRRIRGPAIIISNHTSVFDYAVYLFVFFSRTVRFQMAELLFRKKFLGWLLPRLGGIYVNRDGYDFSFVARSQEILDRGGVVGIFPESRLPLPGEERPLEFKVSAAYLALTTGVPVIPVVTDGSYFHWQRAHVLIGRPIDVREYSDESRSQKDDLKIVSDCLRRRIIELEELLHEKSK